MLRPPQRRPVTVRRILMTVDAVGGVWRYAVDAARGLQAHGVETVLLGLGPRPSEGQVQEADQAGIRLDWLDAPLDWMASGPEDVQSVPAAIEDAAKRHGVDLLHLNLPSQAAGLEGGLPRLVVSHSCVHTWWRAMREGPAPSEWCWQHRAHRRGFDSSPVTLAPTTSHARALIDVYGPIAGLRTVPNGTAMQDIRSVKVSVVLGAGRWWDEGKNGRLLDEAAALCRWPVTMTGSLNGPQGQSFKARHARTPGPLRNSELRILMSRAAIFASPSLYEPFGLAPLEAALAGAALVLADIPTFRELWEDAALFADPHDPAEFARALDAVAADEDLRRDLADRASERAATYTIERQSELLMQAYRDAAKAASAGGLLPLTTAGG